MPQTYTATVELCFKEKSWNRWNEWDMDQFRCTLRNGYIGRQLKYAKHINKYSSNQ